VIKVYFFVIVATSADNDVTQTMLINQIAKMNADYGVGTPFKFTLAGAVKIVNPEWVGRDVDTEEDVFNEMKSRTRIGGPQVRFYETQSQNKIYKPGLVGRFLVRLKRM
jgi:hypothetical protein